MKKLLILIILFCSFSSYAQVRRFHYRQQIPLKYLVFDSYSIKNGDTLYLPAGSTIEEVKEVEKGGKKTTYTSLVTKTTSDIETFDKPKPYERRLSGKANVYVKEEDFSKIYIDYWLTTKTYFAAGSVLDFYTDGEKVSSEKLKESKTYNYYYVPNDIFKIVEKLPQKISALKTKIDSIASLRNNGIRQVDYVEAKKYFIETTQKILSESSGNEESLSFSKALKHQEKSYRQELNSIYNTDLNKGYLWVAYAKEKIIKEGGDSTESVTYYKKFPENAYIKLENRQYIKLNFAAWEMAALTIPIKYRPGITKNSMELPSQANAEFNVSTYLGRTWGSLKYKNQAFEKIKPQGQAFSAGVFLGFNVVELDSASTSLRGEKTLTGKQTSIALTSGVGAVYNIMDFNIGFFVGTDIGFGETGRKWNYSGRPWIGFGIGYNITMIGKKED